MPTAEIVTIGTELLLGETADTNTRFIARTLRGLGIDLYRTQTIGDNPGRIAEVVREAACRAQLVITTGGLGPTVDDPTRQAIAAAAGRPLEFHPELWDQIKARIARYGRQASENQKRQAYLPKDALPIENSVGTAPAFMVETDASLVVCLPGVPREMETLLTEAVVPELQRRFDLHEVIQVRTLHTAGVGEGSLDEKIGDLETLANPTVGLSAHSGVVSIRMAAKAGDGQQAGRMLAELESELRSRLGADIFGADDDTLEGAALAAASAQTWRLVSVEGGTDGALARRLGAARHPAYGGGSQLDGPDRPLLEAAEKALRGSGCDASLGLAVTAGSGQAEVGLCLLTPAAAHERTLSYGGHPANAVRWGVNMALDWLRRTAQEGR
jgi:competence/damage-inducible protein CinA-like protein